MGNGRSTVLMMCSAVLMCESAPGSSTIIVGSKRSTTSPIPAPLRSASGELKHVFSITFKLDPIALSKISGLESLTFARTSAGSGINITLDYGVPHPTKVISMEVIEGVGVDASQVIDPLRPPSAMPSRPGHRLISTFRVPGRKSYLAAWLDVRSGESSLTLWDEDNQVDHSVLIASSSSQILGVAAQPSIHGIPELTIMVWTRGRAAGDVIAGMYGWNRS